MLIITWLGIVKYEKQNKDKGPIGVLNSSSNQNFLV